MRSTLHYTHMGIICCPLLATTYKKSILSRAAIFYYFSCVLHTVWKLKKKSHSALRAKRAMFTFWVDKSSLKMPKIVDFGEFLKTWSLLSKSVTRHFNFNRTNIGGKCQNTKIEMRHFNSFLNNVICLNETFSTMLNHCAKVLEKRSGLPYLTEEKYLHFMWITHLFFG